MKRTVKYLYSFLLGFFVLVGCPKVSYAQFVVTDPGNTTQTVIGTVQQSLQEGYLTGAGKLETSMKQLAEINKQIQTISYLNHMFGHNGRIQTSIHNIGEMAVKDAEKISNFNGFIQVNGSPATLTDGLDLAASFTNATYFLCSSLNTEIGYFLSILSTGSSSTTDPMATVEMAVRIVENFENTYYSMRTYYLRRCSDCAMRILHVTPGTRPNETFMFY